MKLKVSRVEVWMASIDDRAGGAADKLEPLSAAGADFEFVLARRAPESPGKGLLFVYPVKGAKVTRAAQEAGFARSDGVHSVRIEGADRPGAGAKMLRALAAAGINIRAIATTGIGRKFVSFLAVDSEGDAATAASILKKLA